MLPFQSISLTVNGNTMAVTGNFDLTPALQETIGAWLGAVVGADPAKIALLTERLRSNTDGLQASVTAHTSAQPIQE